MKCDHCVGGTGGGGFSSAGVSLPVPCRAPAERWKVEGVEGQLLGQQQHLNPFKIR